MTANSKVGLTLRDALARDFWAPIPQTPEEKLRRLQEKFNTKLDPEVRHERRQEEG